MLHDPSHYEQLPLAEEIRLPESDKDILRRLASELAVAAALPEHCIRMRLWQRLNDLDSARPHNMWGCSNAQIFSEVSPEMHWEFALKHDLRWLARWGMAYYGCCEPLDNKIELLRRIPNLRKISASPWCNTDRMVNAIGTSYVFSHKPSPAIFAGDDWHPDKARAELRAFLDRARGCHVEIVMKDISTVRHKPQRLWEWALIAAEEAQRCAK